MKLHEQQPMFEVGVGGNEGRRTVFIGQAAAKLGQDFMAPEVFKQGLQQQPLPPRRAKRPRYRSGCAEGGSGPAEQASK